MLVLSRKTGERIHIGNNIFIEVRRVAGNRTTLAISAPKEIRILRGELKEAAEAFEEPASPAPAPVVAPAAEPETVVISPQRVESAESVFFSSTAHH